MFGRDPRYFLLLQAANMLLLVLPLALSELARGLRENFFAISVTALTVIYNIFLYGITTRGKQHEPGR